MRQIFLLLLCMYSSITYIHAQEVADATINFHNANSQSVKIMRPNNQDNYTERIIVVRKDAMNGIDSKWVTDTIYYPKNIKSFSTNRYKDVYVSTNLNGEMLFLKEIVNSDEIKVLSKPSSIDSDLFYMKTSNNEELIEIGTDIEPYKGCLIKNSSISPKVFDRMQLTEASLANAFNASNKNNFKYLNSPFQLGVMLGYSRSVLPKTKERKADSDNVLLLGIYANFNLDRNPQFNIRPELYYSTDKYNALGQTSRKSLTLPLMVRYSLIDIKKTIPYVELGPSINLCMNPHYYIYTKSPIDQTIQKSKQTVSTFYYGVAAGVGTEIPITYKYSIYAGFRYHYTYMNGFDINNWMFTVSGNIF